MSLSSIFKVTLIYKLIAVALSLPLLILWGYGGRCADEKSSATDVVVPRVDDIVLSSQAIQSIDLGPHPEGKNSLDWRRDRIQFDNTLIRVPFGEHYFAYKHNGRGYEEFGATIQVGVALRPAPPKRLGLVLDGTLTAFYRHPAEKQIAGGLPIGFELGLFGSTFQAVESLKLARSMNIDLPTSLNFFSLPIDMATSSGLRDFFKVPYDNLISASSFYADLKGRDWMVRCEKTEAGIEVSQCQISVDYKTQKFVPRSPIEVFQRGVGDTHTISDLKFAIAEIVTRPDQVRPTGWVNIADPQLIVPPEEQSPTNSETADPLPRNAVKPVDTSDTVNHPPKTKMNQ